MKTLWQWRQERQETKKTCKHSALEAEDIRSIIDQMSEGLLHLIESIEPIKKTVMKNLLNCSGRRFRCKIYGEPVEGKIQVEDGCVYLCQNKEDGCRATNKLGYKYSYTVDSGSDEYLRIYGVSDFALLMTAEEIEEYKDWQVGDLIKNKNGFKHNEDMEVIFRRDELVVCKFIPSGNATHNFTCDELYNLGCRLAIEPVPESDDSVEVSMAEVAEKLGVPVEKLRIKKE